MGTIECPRDGFPRSDNMRERCPNCQRRNCWFWFNQYLLPSEERSIKISLAIILGTILLVVAGLGLMYYFLGKQISGIYSYDFYLIGIYFS